MYAQEFFLPCNLFAVVSVVQGCKQGRLRDLEKDTQMVIERVVMFDLRG